MSLKLFLVLMTATAVVSDALLHPFYPQYFATVLGVTDPRHVGAYIAACSLTVILSFPVWAHLARRYAVPKLLIVTQLLTALVSLACVPVRSAGLFWALSLLMLVFKASYLLIYPYVLSLERRTQHVSTISLLAFVVYFGHLLAALLAGAVFQLVAPRWLFAVMAAGDVLQTALCLWMRAQPTPGPESESASSGEGPAAPPAPPRHFVALLCGVMVTVYFSAYLTDPFFTAYWAELSGDTGPLWMGAVFALPAIAALAGLVANARRAEGSRWTALLPSMGLGVLGLSLEASGVREALLAGRVLYGWALFQTLVRLDALLFQFTPPERYAVQFSKINLFQGFGVLGASLTAGSLVSSVSPRATFGVAIVGFTVAGLLCLKLETAAPAATPAAEVS